MTPREILFGVNRRDFLRGALGIIGVLLAIAGVSGLIVSEARAQESLRHLNLPSYARPYVNERYFKMTPEIEKLLNTYAFLERGKTSSQGIEWIAVKRQLRGALYIAAGASNDKEWNHILDDATMSIRRIAPKELIRAIDVDVGLSHKEKEQTKINYYAEMVRQFAIKPTMLKDKQNLPIMAKEQQERMAHPREEDNFKGLVGIYDIDPKAVNDQLIRLCTKINGENYTYLIYVTPMAYPTFDFLLKNAEAVEVVAALRSDQSVLARSLSECPLIVLAQPQDRDPKKGIEGGLITGYYQFSLRDPDRMLNMTSDKQLSDLILRVRRDRSMRVTIMEPVDPSNTSPLKSGERESDRVLYVLKGLSTPHTYRRRHAGDDNPEKLFNITRDQKLEALVNRAVEINLGPRLRRDTH